MHSIPLLDKTCVRVPRGVSLASTKRYLLILFVLTIACLKELSQVLARADVSTFMYRSMV